MQSWTIYRRVGNEREKVTDQAVSSNLGLMFETAMAQRIRWSRSGLTIEGLEPRPLLAGVEIVRNRG